jgi:hypothetical protein
MQINIAPPAQDTAADWLQYITALWNDMDNTNRKMASKKVVDYYKNKQRPYLEQALRKIYTDPHSYITKRKWTENITKQIIDALAQCYSCKVKRSVPPIGKRASKLLNDKVFQGINKRMRNANKWLVLEKTTLLYARWNSKYQRVDYRSYHQYEFDIVVDPDSAENELLAVILSDFKPLEDANVIVYTPNNTYWFKGRDLKRHTPHNLGILPFVVLHAEDPGFEDYLEPDTHLINSNLEINVAISNLLNIHQNQAHAIPVVIMPAEIPVAGIDDSNPNTGIISDTETDRRLDINDVNKALVMHHGDGGEAPDFKYVSPQVNFAGAIDTIRYVVNSLAQTYGVDNGIFNIDVSGNPATVFHVNEKRREAIVGDLQSVFIDAEKELFDKAYMLARMSDTAVPELNTQDFIVEFISDANIVNQLSSSDVAKLHELDLIDQIEVIRHHYGDKSRAEAEAFIQEMIEAEQRITELREELMPKPPPPPVLTPQMMENTEEESEENQ